jgi:ubiquinone biosynthesis protein UbiJ
MAPLSVPLIDPLAARAAAALIDRLLAHDATARARLAPFAGRVVRIELPPLAIALEVTDAGRFKARAAATAAASSSSSPAAAEATASDLRLSLASGGLAALLGDPRGALRNLRFEGDAGFAQVLVQVLQSLRFEPEEDLAPWIGDIAAVRLVAGLRAALAGARQAGLQLARSSADYFTAENPLLAARASCEGFAAEVEQLGAAVVRLEARVVALHAAARAPRRRP